jgi:lysophospholipase L1-like esterase
LLAPHDDGTQKIDLLIVELGGNDFLKHVPETETLRNLNAILAQSKARNIQTVLIAIPKLVR